MSGIKIFADYWLSDPNLCPRDSDATIPPHLGGGGGVHPAIFVKLVFEIAVAQQTRILYRTFEEVVEPNRPPVQPCPYLVQLCLIILTCSKTIGVLLVANGLLNS